VKWNPPTRRKARTKPRKTTPHQKQDLKPDWQLANCPSFRAVSGSTTHVG
jgi:hypothetical protein